MSTNTLLESDSLTISAISKNRSLIIFKEPLQKGFGHTLGNALRRVLVSSLTGCAVVEAKIEGVLHEYAMLEKVEEDVLSILLNLRESAFMLTGSRDEVTLELKAHQAGPVTLGAIQLPHDVEIANPEHVIANLTQDRDFHLTLKVMRGQGEHMAGQQLSNSDQEASPVAEDVNVLYLNAIFNPIKRVTYRVEDARVGERTDLDRLVIDLETNGTCTPFSAIQEAASIFFQQGLKVILDLKSSEEKEPVVQNNEVESVLLSPISVLDLSARSVKCLKTEGIYFIGDLVTKTRAELFLTPNLGKRSLKEIETALEKKSLSLDTVLSDWPPAGLSYSSEEKQSDDE